MTTSRMVSWVSKKITWGLEIRTAFLYKISEIDQMYRSQITLKIYNKFIFNLLILFIDYVGLRNASIKSYEIYM